jgi:hypothetical protein
MWQKLPSSQSGTFFLKSETTKQMVCCPLKVTQIGGAILPIYIHFVAAKVYLTFLLTKAHQTRNLSLSLLQSKKFENVTDKQKKKAITTPRNRGTVRSHPPKTNKQCQTQEEK